MIQFLFSLVGVVVALSVASIGWPLASHSPRPAPLEKVYSIVSQTSVGGQLAGLLGVTESTEPINIASVAGNVAGAVSSTVQKKTQEVVTGRIVSELVRQFDTLPEDQQKLIQEQICKIPE